MKADGTPPDEKHRHGIRWSDEEWSWVEAEVAKIGGAKIKTRKR